MPEISDPRGTLLFFEEGKHVPFSIRRVFAIYDVPEGAQRGAHAHRAQHQFLLMLNGACSITIDDGKLKDRVRLNDRWDALHVPPLIWLELADFTPGAICVVATSGVYDEEDYIRKPDEFAQIVEGIA